jgi:glycosyltransferase involved in cell wall biosynthesis
MSKTPVVSIVLPVYNAKSFIHQSIQSVFAQTIRDWECIIVDDASTDGSYEYLQRICDPRVTVVRNERNMKHPETVNRGNDLARGKYIARMDADDIMSPERMAKQVLALEKNPEVDVLGCWTFLTDNNLNLNTIGRFPLTHAEITRWPTINYRITYGTLVGKAEWWRKWRLTPTALHPTSFDLYLRSFRESTYANIADILYVYRFIGNTRTLRKMNRAIYHRCKTLIEHGFKLGMPIATLVGLASMLPRPLLYMAKFAVGSKTGLMQGRKDLPAAEEEKQFKKLLEDVSKVAVPLRKTV